MSEWKAARVGDICKAANGRAFKPTEWDTEGTPIIRIQNLKNDSAPFNYFRGEIEPRFRIRHGDLLFAWSGTPGTSFGAHIWRGGDAVLNQHIFNLHFDREKIDERFFCYALNRNVADYVAKAQGGVGLAHITKGKFEDSFIPLPGIDKQRAVVAEIEKQFSRLDEAVAGLRRVKANLKRYKAAVLKAAVEGRLVDTEADLARRAGRDYETGAQLLQRILATRRQQWQGKGKYKEPATPDTADLPELPEGWGVASLDQLMSRITSGSRDWAPYYNRGEGIFVLAQNVRPIFPDFSTLQSVDPPINDSSRERSRIAVDDLLTTIVGANTGQVCRVTRLPGEAYVCQSVALMRPTVLEVSAYLNYWLNSNEHGQRYFERCMYGQGRPHLSFEQLASVPILLPPLPEQHRIVAEVDRLLSIAREAEAEVEANLQCAQALRQAILARAFQPAAVPPAPTFGRN